MNLDEYQKAALRTINPALDDQDRLVDASVGLVEEAAELLGLVRKRVFQQRDIDQARLTEELGDVLWCLAVVARRAGKSGEARTPASRWIQNGRAACRTLVESAQGVTTAQSSVCPKMAMFDECPGAIFFSG